ncbi:glycosyltransferase family 2 protein [Solimonas soli]|uniref:glycosyltransferase family 2 protein n=1 Tax=Solimonas soli TaxID=413479 RepID=UPI000A05CBED|nr:glycosyltransferase family 2 protein [Solimonas soli]
MNMSKHIISVITVSFNDRKGLIDVHDCLRRQTFNNYEWIVIDGASTDGSVEYLRSVTISNFSWLSEKDEGIYDAMNKGAALANGEYLVFLNAGDVLPSINTLRTVAEILLAEAPDVLFGAAELILPSGRSITRLARSSNSYIWHGVPANQQATYYRTKLVKDEPYDLRYRICGDYYLAAQLVKRRSHESYTNMPLVKFRVGDTSYRNPRRLFMEPYAIQRDVLGLPFWIRARSFFKRGISTVGLRILSSFR